MWPYSFPNEKKPEIAFQNLLTMAYPERKHIYETYEKIVKEIVERQRFKEYATSEIEALDKDLLSGFRAIREKLLSIKHSPSK